VTAAAEGCRPTLILSRGDLAALAGPADYLQAAETAFLALAAGTARSPPPLAIPAPEGAFHGKAAILEGERPYVALKLNGNFPANPERHGLPTIQGALILCDGATGAVLAVMDSGEITLRRTAAATALAARRLARPESGTLLICGCGLQAGAHLQALRELFPLRRCHAWDRDEAKALAFARRAAASGLETVPVRDLDDWVGADIVVACTTARSPYLGLRTVRPGTFVAAVGADSPDKSEIVPELSARATFVADVLAQCAVMGDLHHALRAGAMDEAGVHAELHEIVSGRKPGRSREEEITLFDSTGTGVQDVAAAALLFERARERPGLRRVELAA